MRLTTFTDYSLRVLLYVAHAAEGRATIAEVARAFDISEHHLVKVVHALGRMGVLRNSRGRGGGLRLAGPPSGINVGKVVRATESIAVAECFDAEHNTCALAGRCRLEGILHEAVDAFHAVLDRYTLEDLLAHSGSAKTFLPWPTKQRAAHAP
jgi:Rrf2 family nitric oxide-sensitive transcriptional repressor